ncbi:hypothetical protein [Azospirillum thermophilum]|uniref:RcnB family protein n=1 Tax=Azospirillum thermophilum TaxID=2202148 RepID=A0A2S2CQD5_9PROT|nr:hypothetical protein [Azospirillum thermophilum]AWK86527.1 hypothetical protein DEW08_10000 [Azospirillum thermophilum]
MRKPTTVTLATALTAGLLLGASPAPAEKPDWAGGGQGAGHGGGHGRGQGPDKEAPGGRPDRGPPADRAEPRPPGPGRVSPAEVTVIRGWFEAHPVGVEPLPPGIARKVGRGKPLPPGIAKKMAPVELRQRIPACMTGWECILLGADLLILDAVHDTVADIVRDVVR